MRSSIFFLALVLSVAGCAGPSSGPRATNLNATEKMMWSTYPLGTTKGMATGFVIGCSDATRPGVVVPVIVTAGHMLDHVGKGPLVIGLRIPNKEGEPQVAVIQVPAHRTTTPFYVRHPRQDVGAFEPDLPTAAAGLILPSFLEEKTPAAPSKTVRAGADVAFLGFPDVLPGTSGAFPILRSGKVASYPSAQPHADMFLINADVYPGDSGAPVFTTGRGGKPELAGMVVQRVAPNTKAFSHLAIAVDAKAIRETLQLLAERQARLRGAKEKVRP